MAVILMVRVPNRPSRPKTISIPSARSGVCARRSRPASARGLFGQPERVQAAIALPPTLMPTCKRVFLATSATNGVVSSLTLDRLLALSLSSTLGTVSRTVPSVARLGCQRSPVRLPCGSLIERAPTRRVPDGPGLATRTAETARMTAPIPIKKHKAACRLAGAFQPGEAGLVTSRQPFVRRCTSQRCIENVPRSPMRRVAILQANIPPRTLSQNHGFHGPALHQ